MKKTIWDTLNVVKSKTVPIISCKTNDKFWKRKNNKTQALKTNQK